ASGERRLRSAAAGRGGGTRAAGTGGDLRAALATCAVGGGRKVHGSHYEKTRTGHVRTKDHHLPIFRRFPQAIDCVAARDERRRVVARRAEDLHALLLGLIGLNRGDAEAPRSASRGRDRHLPDDVTVRAGAIPESFEAN